MSWIVCGKPQKGVESREEEKLQVPGVVAAKRVEVVLLSQADGRGDGRKHEFTVEKISEVSCLPSWGFGCTEVRVEMVNGRCEPWLRVGGVNSPLGLWNL